MAMLESTTSDIYPSNTALYKDPNLVETVDYARRYRRQELFDDGLAQKCGINKTTIVAPHGGGIEFGTSELCLAVAGYHPATLAVTPGTGVTYDYWIFEGLRASDNSDLHVTSTHCDDGVALSLCAEALNVLALHGCTTSKAALPDDAEVALVGGLNATFKQRLLDEFAASGLQAIDAVGHKSLDGEEPTNITNRTLLGMGGQVEITGPMRSAMFTDNTRPRRKFTTTKVFWDFAAACRNALARVEAEQVIL
jgi:phage replication-related protein YjqB (UPF0714/DUF867 family)